ncbi:MAG TPA: hypothetical protein VFU14_02440 [Acidimicrobiales bacterium]|nr:hypothetical protein [Acidimicrobiales bacterium]
MLQQLRIMLASFVAVLAILGVVAVAVAPDSGDVPAAAVGGAVVLYGLASRLASRLIERPLDCASPESLRLTYQTRFFLRIAIAEAAALIGFAGVFVSGSWWPYLVGVLFALAGFVRAAPTELSLSRDQDELATTGCALQLRDVLTR